MNILKCSPLLLCIIFLSTTNCYSFDDKMVHPAINEASSQPEQSCLDEVLKEIGFLDGINEFFRGTNGVDQEVFLWMSQGGKDEDADLRAFNHFHDPTKPWEDAGLFGVANSSLIWAQQNDASWNVAREHYYLALTTGADEKYAATFVTLGQLMHLVSDKAVPAHVRDDAHLEVVISKVLDITHFEVWTKKNINTSDLTALLNRKGIGPSQDIFTEAVLNDKAPAPISALWDIDKYDKTNPAVTLEPIIGLAEYTNANFFSEGIAFSAEYPYPAKGIDTEKQTKLIPDPFDLSKEVSREYWMKKATANTDSYRLTGIGYLTFSVQSLHIDGFEKFKTLPPMDTYVFEGYANLLIPRAVGYSAALLDYFFRGQLEVTLPTDPDSLQTNGSGGYNPISLRVENISPRGEDMTTGSIELVVKYKIPDGTALESYPAPPLGSGEYLYIVGSVQDDGSTINQIARYNPVDLVFDLPDNGLPTNAVDVRFQVVYKGGLGDEKESAIATGGVNYPIDEHIEILVPESGNYSLINLIDSQAPDFQNITLQARNTTLGDMEMTGGQIELDLKYRLAQNDALDEDPDMPVSEEYVYLHSVPENNNIDTIPRDIHVELNFDISSQPIPTNAVDLVMQVRFVDEYGQLYTGIKDISEPSPIDMFNTGDIVCINEEWYVAGSPEAIAQVDTNNDGIAGPWEADVYPHNFEDIYWLFSSLALPAEATTLNYDFELSFSAAGEYQTLGYILTDYSFYNFSRNGAHLLHLSNDDNYSDNFYLLPVSFGGKGFKNQVIFTGDPASLTDRGNEKNYSRKISPLSTTRGIVTWIPYFLVNPEISQIPCDYGALPE